MSNEPDIDLCNMLRIRLIDPNPSRIVGTPYIVTNFPYQTNLTYNHFPRVSVINQFESQKCFGIGSTTTLNTARLQIDIWSKMDNVVTIDANPYEGLNEVRKISRDVTEKIRQYWISDMATTGQIIYQVSINFYSIKVEYDYGIIRRTGDVSFVILRTG